MFRVVFRQWLVAPVGLATAMLGSSVSTARAQAGTTISGNVRDATTGQGVEAVRLSTGQNSAVTGRGGDFMLVVQSDTATVWLKRIGYRGLRTVARDLGKGVALTPEPVLLTSLVVGGSEVNQLAAGTALAVTGASRSYLDSNAGTSLAERLAGLEGVSVQRWSSWGATTMLRGLGDDRIAVMINGVRVNRACPFGMDQGLATIDPATIERIEILSGPGSTLYGSGNIGGIINVVTRRPITARHSGGEIRAGGSSAVPGGSAGASVWGQGARFDYAVALDGAAYGDYRSPAGRVASSSFTDGTFDANLGANLTPSQRLSLQLQGYAGRDIGYAAMGATIPREFRSLVALDYGWQLSRGFLDAMSARVFLQRLDHRMEMDMPADTMMPDMPTRMGDRSHASTTGARAQVRLIPWGVGHVDAGTELTLLNADGRRLTEIMDASGNSSSLTLKLWPGVGVLDAGSFAQGEVPVGKMISLSGGARLDRVVKDADESLTAREWVATGNAGLRLELPSGIQIRGSFGAGYRVPNPSELFGLELKPDGNIYRGNAALRTETSRNIEATVAWTHASAFASVTGFRNDVSRMVSPALATDQIAGRQVFDYRNLSSARLSGVTSSVRVEPSHGFLVSGVASYTRGENREDGSPLPLIPPLEWKVTLRDSNSAMLSWIEGEVQGAAKQSRVSELTGEQESSAYAILNLRAKYNKSHISVVTGLDNIFNREFRSHVDPQNLLRPGRNAYIHVTRSF